MADERYIVRAEMVWKVIRPNHDGTETVVMATASEREAKAMAAQHNNDEGLDE